MRISNTGLNLIKRFEGFVDHVYADVAGHATAGYGHLLHKGKPTLWEKIKYRKVSEKQAEDWLRVDVMIAENAVNELVNTKLTQNQFDALVSLVFNIGVSAFKLSTLLKFLNENEISNAAREFGRWVNAGGKRIAGLINRRMAERRLFLTPSEPESEIKNT